MTDKLIQPTSDQMLNGLTMLRNNLLPVQDNQSQHQLFNIQQHQNTLGQYLATIQYLTKQQQPNQLIQQNQNLNNLDNLLIQQQHQLRQQLLNGQNNSNGNSPLSTQSLPDHDNYIDVINNLPQLFNLQQRQQLVNQQLESNTFKNQALKDNLIRNDKQQELISKTLNNQLSNNQLNNNQLNNQHNNQLNQINHNKFIDYQQQVNILNDQQQIIQNHQSSDKFTSSPLAQIAQMTVIDKSNNLKCLENKKTDSNKTVDLKQLRNQFQKNLSAFTSAQSNKLSNNKQLDKKDNNLEKMDIRTDQNNSKIAIDSNKKLINNACVDEQGKPFHNYIGLIAQAILKSKDGQLVLSEIYGYILENYPYYRHRNAGWRNSIRHNLSLNDCFVKGSRAANGKGHYWYINPANRRDFEKGDFRRRRAQRKARRLMFTRDSTYNDDQDSEDEEVKKQFLNQINQYNHFNQLNLQQFNIHNFYNHLNSLNNLNPSAALNSTTSAANINCPPNELLNSNEDYLNYLELLKRNWFQSNVLNSTLNSQNNPNNLEIKPNNNLAIQSQSYQMDNLSVNNTIDNQIKKANNQLKDDDDSEIMLDIETETKNEIKIEKNIEDKTEIEIEKIEDIEPNNNNGENLNNELNNKNEFIDQNLINKMINNLDNNDSTTNHNTNLNLRNKHKFDVDSLLKNEKIDV